MQKHDVEYTVKEIVNDESETVWVVSHTGSTSKSNLKKMWKRMDLNNDGEWSIPERGHVFKSKPSRKTLDYIFKLK